MNISADAVPACKKTLHNEGYIILRNFIRPNAITRLLNVFLEWNDQVEIGIDLNPAQNSRKKQFVTDGTQKFRYLQRVNNPCDINDDYFQFVLDKPLLHIARDFLGNHVRFHHCKINCKSSASPGDIDPHQDFGFDPHTNRSLLTIAVPLVNLSKTNGCIRVVPKSHKQLISHFENGIFIGRIPNGWSKYEGNLIPLEMELGSILVMDGALIHGSRSNNTSELRPVLFCEYSAADALPLAPYHVPSKHSGLILPTPETPTKIRLESMHLEIPEEYQASSIFELQRKIGEPK